MPKNRSAKTDEKPEQSGLKAFSWRRNKSFLFLLGALLLLQMWQMYKFYHQGRIIESVGENRDQMIAELNQAQEFLNQFALDLNEVRGFLLLPTRDYNFNEEEVSLMEGTTTEVSEEEMSVAVFGFVDQLGAYQNSQTLVSEQRTALQAALTDVSWLSEMEITMTPNDAPSEGAYSVSFVPNIYGVPFLTLTLEWDGHFEAKTYGGTLEFSDSTSFEVVWEELTEAIKSNWSEWLSNYQQVSEALNQLSEALFVDPMWQALLAEKGLSVSNVYESDTEYLYEILNADQQSIATVSLKKSDASYFLKSQNSETTLSGEALVSELVEAVGQMDTRTILQKKFEQTVASMDTLLSDEAFEATLDRYGFQMGAKSETDRGVEYPILDDSGNVLRILLVDRSTGDLKVITPGQENLETISDATETLAHFGKKKTMGA